jgi:Obg family GTPase CgtA
MAAFDNVDEDAFAPSEDELLGLTRGRPAQEVALSLVLRTVADVGFVGFPNAGKSTLLGALSRATPEVAPFPFTTLMPNLGAMQQASASPSASTAATAASTRSPTRAPPVLADLPGLVEDAHQGRGLGRLFLRHLRRVRVVLYVLDTNCKEPSVGEQYDVLKRELRLYNPQYLERPHVVALNKLDIPLEADGEEAMKLVQREATRAIAVSAGRSANETAAPVAVVPISGMRRKGMRILKEALEKALDVADDVE